MKFNSRGRIKKNKIGIVYGGEIGDNENSPINPKNIVIIKQLKDITILKLLS